MPGGSEIALVKRCYRRAFGARLRQGFDTYLFQPRDSVPAAALGFRRAGPTPLFLEAYLDGAVEEILSKRVGRRIARASIVEIGNFASTSALAMIELWSQTANDLGGGSEYAVATLTAPLRTMFARIGLPLIELAHADPGRISGGADGWGDYYLRDPCVCAGSIADGQRALARFAARQRRERRP